MLQMNTQLRYTENCKWRRSQQMPRLLPLMIHDAVCCICAWFEWRSSTEADAGSKEHESHASKPIRGWLFSRPSFIQKHLPISHSSKSLICHSFLSQGMAEVAQPVLSSGALDSKGYALFGTPGPGQYDTVTQFNDGKLLQSAKGGKHVFTMQGKFSIKGKPNTQEVAPDSPGPAAHQPAYECVSPNTKPAVIGSSTRAGEARRFVSHTAKPQLADDVPGPGTYRSRCGKGHAKTMGDAPHATIGTASRPPIYSVAAGILPGAKYHIPPTLGSGPHACMGPRESALCGDQRDRMHEANLSKTFYHGVSVVDAVPSDSPGPSAYSPADHLRAGRPAGPCATFGKAAKESLDRYAMGGPLYEESKKGLESAPHLFPAISTLAHTGGARSVAPRFPDLSKGISGAGPLISKNHAVQSLGVDSPGSIYDHTAALKQLGRSSPAYTIGNGQRSDMVGDDTPGAAAYLMKKGLAEYKYASPPAFGIAAAIRTDWSAVAGGADAPGPGAHDCLRGISRQDIQKRTQPSFRIGEVVGKLGRQQALLGNLEDTPGPGHYSHAVQVNKAGSPKFSLGRRDGISEETMLKSRLPCKSAPENNRQIRRFYSRVQDAAGFGTETGDATMADLSGRVAHGRPAQTSKEFTGKMARASRATDAKVFLSHLHSKVVVGSDSPGPAQYSPIRAYNAQAVSDLKSHGGYSFGKAVRPGQAKISF
eukprot:jgi/Ulvmu1/7316/UM035_0105.1